MICKIIGHKFVSLNGEVICERCGKNNYQIAKSIFGKVKEAQIIRREDEIEKALKDVT